MIGESRRSISYHDSYGSSNISKLADLKKIQGTFMLQRFGKPAGAVPDNL